MVKKEEEEEEEELDEDEEAYKPGDNYYSYVSLFHDYNDEFTTATSKVGDAENYEGYCEIIKRDHFSNDNFDKHCHNVAKYLEYIKGKKDGNEYERCIHLNYVLNSNDEYNNFLSYDNKSLFQAYHSLSEKLKICHNNIAIISENILEKVSDLYNFYAMFHNMVKSIDSPGENFCKYAENSSQLYNNIKKNCQIGSGDGFCEELKKIREKYYLTMKYENRCSTAPIALEPEDIEDSKSTILFPFAVISVITSILFILHKFTPLGFWAGTQIRKRINIFNNLPKETLELLENSRSQQLSSEQNQYNVQYIPT
ncbi:PIR Superfamily Protein [Plasmodium ovale wallikeri]|uniref:PIR Superfamily Protein n=2 Tax=Plasmodium ovale TaxID=36330 RepID=A0A1A9A7F3_PLAOA|nr:PIR Superfamily Protein [Plasmodium ovale wallikeri]SBT55535.1 PIR Superfamily Protein [Plasmodium ovale wallikeri]SBT74126.1 PIR protein [Plasmodium ovale]